MFLITSIKSVERTVYVADEHHDGPVTSILVGSFCDIHVCINAENLIFKADVCPTPHGPQVDWSDEFQDLMMEHHGDFKLVNYLLFQLHNGELVDFPVTVGRVV